MNDNEINVKMCKSFFSRLFGLMFKNNFDYGLIFPNCNSIHTFFMRKNIDVIMTDIDGNILHVYKDLKPNKIILPKKNVYYTLEFPSNKVDIDKVDIKKLIN